MRSGGTSLFVTSSPRAHSTCSTTPLSADIYQSESLLAICACASSTACRLYECCLSTCVCFVSASLLFPLEYFVVLLLSIVYNCCTIVVLLSCYCYTILVMLLNHYVLLFKLGSNSLLRTQIYANIQQVYNKYTTSIQQDISATVFSRMHTAAAICHSIWLHLVGLAQH